MITLRAARNSALRLSRTAAAVSSSHVEAIPLPLPHAESSSAPFRRQLSSTPRIRDAAPSARGSQAEGGRFDEQGGSPSTKGKGKSKSRPNPRLRKQALANAKKLAEALKSEVSAKPALPPSAKQDIPLPDSDSNSNSSSTSTLNSDSTSGDTFWADMLTKPTTTTGTAMAAGSSAKTTSASSTDPTLDDLLAKRPAYAPREPWHPRYPKQYRRIYDSIDSAFVLTQVRDFAKKLDIRMSGRTRSNKSLIIKKIMRSWDWMEPIPKPVERPPESKVFDLPAPELFLFLRDNELVQSFAQHEDDPLELSVVPFSQAPKSVFNVEKPEDQGRMVLLAIGRDEPLARLNAALKERRESIHTLEFSGDDVHNHQAPAGLLQMVSNATGAFVEPIADSRYRATAMSIEDAEEAKRLLSIAAFRTTILPSSRSLNAVLPVVPHFLASSPPKNKFSLYPFAPSLTEPLQWDIAAQNDSKSLFRLKKVQQWANKPALREMEQKQEHIGDGQVRSVLSSSSMGRGGFENRNLQKALSEFVGQGTMDTKGETSQSSLSVSFGHLLYPVSPKDGRIGTWDSPLPGQWYLETLQKWMSGDEGKRPFFAPSLTPAMVQYPLSGTNRQIRRLRYRTAPSSTSEAETSNVIKESQFLSFTYNHPYQPAESKSTETGEDAIGGEGQSTQPDAKWQDRLGDFLDQMEKEIEAEEKGAATSISDPESNSTGSTTEAVADGAAIAVGGEGKVEETTPIVNTETREDGGVKGAGAITEQELVLFAERGILREIDLHIPDRPSDARFTAITSSPLGTGSIPESMTTLFRSYLGHDQDGTASSSSAPAQIELEGVQYELELDEYLEVNEENAALTTSGLVKRMIKSVDQSLGGHAKPIVYNEIEYTPDSKGSSSTLIPEEFFDELAMITRDIGPDASALNRNAAAGGVGGGGGNPLLGLSSWDQ
ncbi:hypothetical protein IAT40_007131 [Kwoniella sp. CBS 6097]